MSLEITEKQFEAQVKEVAKLFRWKYYHPFLSKWSESGYPDITLVRGNRLIIVELKSEKGKLTKAQAQWLWALRKTPAEIYIWRPRHMEPNGGKIVEILR